MNIGHLQRRINPYFDMAGENGIFIRIFTFDW